MPDEVHEYAAGDALPRWLDLKAAPPPFPGWYWAWDGDRGHAPLALHWTGPAWVYVGGLGGTLEQVAWHYPWYWPARLVGPPVPPEDAT
jgi:hypothetical protein